MGKALPKGSYAHSTGDSENCAVLPKRHNVFFFLQLKEFSLAAFDTYLKNSGINLTRNHTNILFKPSLSYVATPLNLTTLDERLKASNPVLATN